ncbi:helix-turn-helix domain-containing protein [Bacillus daqingensis]|uniref:Helix-turn-helix domain-containing protein n=1 Tax=Bacillus daqingensis TaxID=872396 RepID=A0ABV9NXJ0_9BACI
MNRLAELILQGRQNRKLSLEEMANRCGISKSYLNYLERGYRKNPSIKVASRIAAVLQVPLEEVVSRIEEDEADTAQGGEASLCPC